MYHPASPRLPPPLKLRRNEVARRGGGASARGEVQSPKSEVRPAATGESHWRGRPEDRLGGQRRGHDGRRAAPLAAGVVDVRASSPRPSGFPSPPPDGCPKSEDRFAERGPPQEEGRKNPRGALPRVARSVPDWPTSQPWAGGYSGRRLVRLCARAFTAVHPPTPVKAKPATRAGWCNSFRVAASKRSVTQGSSVRAGRANLATLGWRIQSLRDWARARGGARFCRGGGGSEYH